MPYNNLLDRIKQSGQSWSQYDLDTAKNNLAFGNTIFSAKNDWAKAHAAGDRAGMDAANAAAENARRTYGSYLGGSEGSRYYGLGGPASYQSPYSGVQSDTLSKMQNYGSFTFDQKKPAFSNTYGGLLDDALKKMQNYGSFSYGSAPTYNNRYQEQIDSLLQQVQGYGPFSWSKETDPAYSAYAKQYRREGDRATANALAQAAAATGGQVSTAAMTAASQAGDYYAGQLADKIPELYENAYQRYLSDYSLLTNKLGQTQQTEQYDYAKYLDQLGQFNTDRALSYDQWLQGYNMLSDQAGHLQNAGALDLQRYQTELGQYNNDRNFAYGQWADDFNRLGAVLDAYRQQDDTGYNRYLDQVGYNTSQDQTAYERAMQAAQLQRQQQEQAAELARAQVDAMLSAGARPSDSLVAGSGYQGEYVQALENYYRQQAAQAASSGRSGGGGSGGSSSPKSGAVGDIYQYLYDSGVRSEGAAYAALRDMGYSSTDANRLAKYFGADVEAGAYGGVGGETSATPSIVKSTPKEQTFENSQDTGLTNKVRVTEDGRRMIYVDGIGAMSFEGLIGRVNNGMIDEIMDPRTGLTTYRRH